MKAASGALLTFLMVIAMGCEIGNRRPSEMTSLTKSQPLAKEKILNADIKLDLGSIEVSGSNDPSSLYSLELDYDKANCRPEIGYTSAAGGEEGRLSFELINSAKAGVDTKGQGNRLHVDFGNSVPLNLKIRSGVGDSRLNISGNRLVRLDFESGVGSARISSYGPNPVLCETIRMKSGIGGLNAVGLGNLNFRNLEFAGGVGAADIDFTGEWKQDADIQIQVGVGAVFLKMPRTIGVRVEAPKNILSGLHLDNFTKRDSYYYSDNYNAAKIHVSIRVVTGIGECRIGWA
jgi:hypothetical protein